MDYYRLCCQHHNQIVRINDRYGNVHVGRIMNVTRSKVYLQPVSAPRGPRGYGLGYYGGYRGRGYGYGYGYGVYGLGIGLITGFALGLLFW
ncbi:hypothetical protein GJU40_12190 [Bacillus lacus]|uniref:Uncharacterized protein n=1 Tax=Metabacillus lacus TaxID=1983721 RepID=A0A7X2IZY5_9BACI|nr:hypothetical protein [Metabacillus lacus]MRX72900.1 hypothetical protein [Metabacillus lacus]